MGKKKAGTKSGREEVEVSSKGSSNVKRLKRWKRARYILIYLALMDEVVNKTISLDGPMRTCRFWVSFTAEFNKRVKESITKPRSLARFEDFEMEDVMKYGEGLWQTYKENKRCKTKIIGAEEEEDRISELPDEILIQILNLLTLKEAIATGILSKRWNKLWASCPNLDFGCLKPLKLRKPTYMRCVANILSQYSAKKLHRFRIVRPVESGVLYEFDDWISFAFKYGVSELELNLNSCPRPGDPKNYYFPAHVFGLMHNTTVSIKQFESLTDLSLRSVNLTDHVFDLILSSCLSLERFILEYSLGLVNAKNTAPHLKLKSLELYSCNDLEYLQVLAPNLISFKYKGRQKKLCIKDAKQLASLRLSKSIARDLGTSVTLLGARNFVFSQFSSHFPKLKSLVVSAHLFKDMIDFTELSVFSSLKQLAVDVNFVGSTYLGYKVAASIIRGAPLLELLEIVLPPCIVSWYEYPALELASMPLHQSLKEVKLYGFRGDDNTMEFLSYLSENTVSLQKIDITPHTALRLTQDLEVNPALYWKTDAAEYAKNCVLQLRQTLHAHTQLLFHNGD